MSKPKSPLPTGDDIQNQTMSGRRAEITALQKRVRELEAQLETAPAAAEREQALAEKTLYLDNILQSATGYAIAATDLDFRITYYNPLAEEFFGYTKSEVIGKTVQEMHTREKVEPHRFEKAIENVRAHGEHAYLVKEELDTGTRYLDSRVSGIYDSDGELVGFALLSRDITARRQAEEKSHRLSQAVEQSANTVVITDLKGNIEYVNPRFEETTGYTAEEALGQNPRVINSGEQSAAFYRDMWETIASGKEWSGEFHNKRKDGTLYWELATISPVYDTSGQMTHFVAVKEDVTERKQAEREMQASEERFRSVVEYAQSGILILDDAYRFIYVNDELCRITGYEREELIGMDFRAVLTEESVQLVADRYVRRQKGEDVPSRYEFSIVRKDGEERLCEISSTAFKDSEGNAQSVGQLLDITERKQLEQQVQESLERRTSQVQISTQMGQEIAAAPALDELFQRVVHLVRERLGYNHVHVFTMEDDDLIMQEGSGEAGRKMKEAGFAIPLNAEKSLVARAARTGESVLTPDVSQDPGWLPTSLLPRVQSELAVPIKLGDETLGVLDAQNDAVGSLDKEDQLLLEGLCGQIAVAINSRQIEGDRLRSEEALREATGLQKAILDNAAYAIISTTPEGVLETFNPAAQRMLGYTAEEVVGKETPAIIHDVDEIVARAKTFSEELNITIEPGFEVFIAKARLNLPNEYEWTYIRKDGVRFPVLLSVTALRNAKGDITGFLGIAQDITERKQAAETLAKQSAELETVLQVSTDAAEILDTDKLLQQVVDLTKERFNLYHAHIYLLDDITNKLNLTAGAGDVGRKMTAQGWSIPLDRKHSLVAQAARSRKGVIANDVRQNPGFFPNPLLPDTRSELAVPLVAGDTVLGVLDVQADKIDYFTDQDARIQSALAAQIAVALQNARLFAEQEKNRFMLQERVKGLNLLNEIGQETDDIPPIPQFLQWIAERIPFATQHAELCIAAIEFDGQVYGKPEAINLPSQIAYGLYIGGQLKGRLYTAYTEKREFINEESAMLSAVATRVSGYIENRRLIEQTEAALEEANLLRRAVEQSLDGSAVADMDGNLLFVNSAWVKMHGYDDVAELLGKPLSIFHTAEQLQNEVEPFNAQVVQKGAHQDEVGHKRKDGTTFPTWMTVAVLLDAEGKPAGLAAAAQDITQRKQMEEAIRADEALYHSLLDAVPQNLYRVDREGRVVFGNKAYLELMGMSLEEMIGKTIYDLASEDMADKYTADDRRVMQSGEIFEEVEIHTERTTGKTTYVQTVKSPVRDLSGQIIGVQGIFWDITEQRESAIERERLLAEVEGSYRQYVRQEWSQFLREQQDVLRVEVQSSSGGGNGATIEMPIALRGQAIGSLKLEDTDPKREWSEDESALVEAVSEQLALTMENLRLFEDTQQQATREQLTRQITDKMRAAPDIDSIIESGLSALAGALNAPRAYVKLTSREKPNDEHNPKQAS